MSHSADAAVGAAAKRQDTLPGLVRARAPLLALLLTMAVGALLPLYAIDVPGPQGDEVYMPFVALQIARHHAVGQPSIVLFGRQWPLTISQYTGALPVYVYLALTYIVKHPLLFRFVNIGYAVLSIALVYLLSWDLWRSRRTSLIAAALFAVIPSSVSYSRIGEYAVYLRVPLSLALLICGYRFLKSGRSAYLYIACFVLGLGVNVRFEMLWWVPVLVAWALLLWREGRPSSITARASVRMAGLATCAFLIGSIPFLIYLLRYWPDFYGFMRGNAAVTAFGADNRQLLPNLATRCGQLAALVDGGYQREFGSHQRNWANDLYFGAAALFGMAAVVRGFLRRNRATALELLFAATAIILVESTITLSVLKTWHIMLLLPVPVCIVAHALGNVTRRRTIVGLLLVVTLLAFNALSVAQGYKALLEWRGYAYFSTRIYDLVSYLQTQNVPCVVTGDWGFARLIYLLSDGNVDTVEVLDYGPHPPFPDWFQKRLAEEAKPGSVWVFLAPPHGDQAAHDAFLQHASRNGMVCDTLTMDDQYGPVYQIHRLKEAPAGLSDGQ